MTPGAPSSTSPPPKFQGGSNPIIGPTTPAEWADFYRWLFAQWQQVQTVVSEQSVTLSSFPPPPSQNDTGGELRATPWPAVKSLPENLPPALFPPSRETPETSPETISLDFPRYYVLPTIGPTIIDVVANIALYPASAYSRWLFLDSATLLFQYSDGANWIPIPINTATAGTYGDGNTTAVITLDPDGRISALSRATISFVTISAPLTGGTITGSATIGQELIEVDPAGTIAALTVNLEAADLLPLGTIKRVAFSQIVTALTFAASGAGGGAIEGVSITAVAVNSSFAFEKIASKTWRRLY